MATQIEPTVLREPTERWTTFMGRVSFEVEDATELSNESILPQHAHHTALNSYFGCRH
jgi:hypothetical protein